MAIIKILDEHIANQIAAGEVVERPSSVVKELVENSIDAGSTCIDVYVEEGGLQLIRVKDNGCGIGDEDAEQAFLRHATSKIYTGKDLFSIRSLGFRGEALPSIAAVAKVELVTATDSSGLGRRLVMEGGIIKSFEPAPSMQGTEMTVRDLFYNTPARLKYMKTVQTELGHIADSIYRLSLSYPGIAFTLKHHDHTLLQTLGNGDLLQVIASVYGVHTAKGMLQVKAEHLDFEVNGYIGKPELTRSNRNAMSWIMNGRFVRSFPLNQAIVRAYHTFLPIHRYPMLVLHVNMQPSLVDVNVHPAKLEVRFSKEAELCAFIEETTKSLLHNQQLIPQAASTKAKVRTHVEQPKLQWQATELVKANEEKRLKPMGALVVETEKTPSSQIHEMAASYEKPNSNLASQGGELNVRPQLEQPAIQANAEKWQEWLIEKEGTDNATWPKFPTLSYIGQVHGTYLIASNEEGLYLIDQHAAHERIHYEYYFERFGKPVEASQGLLIPITLEFTPADADRIRARMHLLEQAGIVMEAFGGQTYLVRSHPYWFPAGEEAGIIQEMTDWVLHEKALDIAKFREASATLCACKASIKANQRLTEAEAETLFVRLATCHQPFTCPHGRPIVIWFTTYDLEKMFKRIMS